MKPRDIQNDTENMVITCMDHRFQRSMEEKLLSEHGVDILSADRLAFPGASKAIADGTLIPAIEKSHELHQISRVVVVDHENCGGFPDFGGDSQKETEAHAESLGRATEAIHKVLPDIVVLSFVATLDGEVVRIETNG